MAKAAHSEFHFLASETVRDVVIGMSDGLTVPFALAAGLTGATAGGGIIVTAGLAEIAAGAVAMGLGGYLAARTDVEHYRAELAWPADVPGPVQASAQAAAAPQPPHASSNGSASTAKPETKVTP